jgi:hypothetical protein
MTPVELDFSQVENLTAENAKTAEKTFLGGLRALRG